MPIEPQREVSPLQALEQHHAGQTISKTVRLTSLGQYWQAIAMNVDSGRIEDGEPKTPTLRGGSRWSLDAAYAAPLAPSQGSIRAYRNSLVSVCSPGRA